MNRIELYIDKNERLTIDFYLDSKDEYFMSRFKGKATYPIISNVCKTSIKKANISSDEQTIHLQFDNCILNIDECQKVFNKRGTGPIKLVLSKYLEDQKQKKIENKKVQRKNKYTGKIIAGVLVLSMLTAVFARKTEDRKKEKDSFNKESTSHYLEEDNSNKNFENKKTQPEIYIEQVTLPTVPIEEDFYIEELNNVTSMDIYIDYEDRSHTEKAKTTKAYYGEIIEKYSKMYGLDPMIVTAIATQERGVHSQTMDSGGATGLMQIQNSVWLGNELTAYNCVTGKKETVVVTKEDLSDVFKNIKYGCMIFQNCIDYMRGNVLAAIQCYNMGYGNMRKILTEYSLEINRPIGDILTDISDCGWLNHRDIIKVGDQEYLEHVFSWIGPNVKLNILDNKGNSVCLNISNQSMVKNIS